MVVVVVVVFLVRLLARVPLDVEGAALIDDTSTESDALPP